MIQGRPALHYPAGVNTTATGPLLSAPISVSSTPPPRRTSRLGSRGYRKYNHLMKHELTATKSVPHCSLPVYFNGSPSVPARMKDDRMKLLKNARGVYAETLRRTDTMVDGEAKTTAITCANAKMKQAQLAYLSAKASAIGKANPTSNTTASVSSVSPLPRVQKKKRGAPTVCLPTKKVCVTVDLTAK